jgi:hypothetical protein
MKTYQLGFLTIRGGAGIMASLIVIGALFFGFAPALTVSHLALTPEAVWGRWEVWQLLSYNFIPEPSAVGVIFSVAIILSLGSQLELQWGTARLWRIMGGIGISTGVLTTLLALVSSALSLRPIAGAHVGSLTMWVAMGLMQRRSMMQFWSLPVTGYTFAAIGLAFSLLNGLFSSWVLVVPDLIAAALTFLVVHEGFPSSWWLRLRSNQLQRELKKRSAHLKGIDGGREKKSDYLN